MCSIVTVQSSRNRSVGTQVATARSGVSLERGGRSLVLRVLVVEDDAPIASLISEALAHHGFEVIAVGDGAAALAALDAARPDAIVLDLMLPAIHGWAFIEQY